MKKFSLFLTSFAAVLVITGCGHAATPVVTNELPQGDPPSAKHVIDPSDFTNEIPQVGSESQLAISDYFGNYSITDVEFGTEVTVTVSGDTRTIVTNALPNHKTGAFPSDGNPNTISAQSKTYTYPVTPVLTGENKWAREPGIAINGVKFEPETAERVTCDSGEVYKVEAIQELANLGLDFNNAHVQPTGAYHYHGVSEMLVDAFDPDRGDLVHVGFAQDGHHIYVSKSNAYTPSYKLTAKKRVGTSCDLALGPQSKTVVVDGTTPDGTYVSDWEFDASIGNLDECNGINVNGTYMYFITNDYPYIGRCLKGAFTETHPGGGQSAAGQGRRPSGLQGGPPSGQPPFGSQPSRR